MYSEQFACGKSTSNNDTQINAKAWSSTNCALGGGTTLIGDPSGKDSTRKILNQKEINKNIKSIKSFQ